MPGGEWGNVPAAMSLQRGATPEAGCPQETQAPPAPRVAQGVLPACSQHQALHTWILFLQGTATAQRSCEILTLRPRDPLAPFVPLHSQRDTPVAHKPMIRVT